MEPAAAAAGWPEKLPGHDPEAAARAVEAAAEAALRRAAPWPRVSATAAGLVAVGLGGAALLVWWALAFHPAHARLWMVPAGLVLLGTPVMAWLSLLASGPCGRQPSPPPGAGAYASV
ncbi:hypothetical protein SEVIR_7G219900v4 [Setaria viridis]|uniref:Uncharacterized protein n=2 Tax=Setaria TaxID=4554 RepID=K3YAY5_SETIT|nr:hypothetical protein SETIT_7G208100v2 [Setaria italica]